MLLLHPLPPMYLFGLLKSDRLRLYLHCLCPNCLCCLKGGPPCLVLKHTPHKDARAPSRITTLIMPFGGSLPPSG